MKKNSTANAIFTLSLSLACWLLCQTESLQALADNQAVSTLKIVEQKAIAKTSGSHLQFDKQARVHRCAVRDKQDLTLDQGF